MKTNILILAIIFCTAGFVSSCSESEKTKVKLEERREGIATDGNKVNRSASSFPITVLTTEHRSIEVCFESAMGILDISLTDSTGKTHYQKTADTGNTDKLNIDISNLPAGSYTIAFADVEGNTIQQGKISID